MRLVWDLPWCVGGDFNEVRLMHERNNCNRRGMHDFNKFFDSEELTDSPIVGASKTRSTFSDKRDKSVLLRLPVYYFSLFVAPIFVVKQIKSTIRNFLWDDASGGKKHHWVGWKKVSIPRARGGLGIRNLKGMNRALLKKWWWSLGKERHSLWAKIIHEKYGNQDSIWRTTQSSFFPGFDTEESCQCVPSRRFSLCK